MDARIELQPAFVLHSRPYRDTSAIVDLFTQDFGRVSAVSKGQRRRTNSSPVSLQPFRLVLISWVGKSELKSITNVEFTEKPYRIVGDALLSCFYLNELLVRMTHRFDPHSSVFKLYQGVLECLSVEDVNGQLIERQLRQFELSLLQELGYGLSLEIEADGVSALQADNYYRYDSQHGFVRVGEVIPAQWVHRCFSGTSLLSLSAQRYEDAKVLSDAKRLLRLALAPYLGDKPLESRKLFLRPTMFGR